MKSIADKITVETIRLIICGKPVDLTVQQARDLQSELNKLFGAVQTWPVIIREVHSEPVWYPITTPLYPNTAPNYPIYSPVVTCTAIPSQCGS